MRPRTRFPVRSYLRHVASRSTYSPVCVVCENSARYSLISVIPRRCPYIYLPPVSSSRRSGQKPSSSPYSLPTRRPHLHGKRSSSPSKVKRGTRAGERTRRALFVSFSLASGRPRGPREWGDIQLGGFFDCVPRTWYVSRRCLTRFFLDFLEKGRFLKVKDIVWINKFLSELRIIRGYGFYF